MLKQPFGFLRPKQKSVPPPPAFDLTPNEARKKGSFNRTVVTTVVVFTVLAAVMYYGVVKRRGGEGAVALGNDEHFVREKARYEAEKQVYEEQHQALIDQHGKIKAERGELVRLLQANQEKAARNNEDYQEMFAESKGEHANSDEADSIHTVFMLKDDLEAKKKQMIDTNQTLGQERQRLLQALQNLTSQGNEVASMHNDTFKEEKPLTEF